MSESQAGRTIGDIHELVEIVELSEFRTYRLFGQRVVGEETREPSQSLTVQAGGDTTHLECRVRMALVTEHAELEAEIGVVYVMPEPVEMAAAVVAEFIEKVGIMAVFPFLREAVFTTATRLGVPAPVVGILRLGDATVEFDENATWPPRGDSSPV